jgi:hypothetical protein
VQTTVVLYTYAYATDVFLHFVLMMQTRLFAVQVVLLIFWAVSEIQHILHEVFTQYVPSPVTP